jgi:hypothetical protein
MMEKLSEKDIRMLKIGAVAVAAIIVFLFGSAWFDHWSESRRSLEQVKAKLELIDVDKARQAGLMSIVPVIEMPQKEETQTILFRNKLNEQLKKAGISSEPLQVLPGSKTPRAGYKLVRLKCNAKCRLTQVLDLLAGLNENPYLVGIEELRLRCDQQRPQEVEMELTISTFVK